MTLNEKNKNKLQVITLYTFAFIFLILSSITMWTPWITYFVSSFIILIIVFNWKKKWFINKNVKISLLIIFFAVVLVSSGEYIINVHQNDMFLVSIGTGLIVSAIVLFFEYFFNSFKYLF